MYVCTTRSTARSSAEPRWYSVFRTPYTEKALLLFHQVSELNKLEEVAPAMLRISVRFLKDFLLTFFLVLFSLARLRLGAPEYVGCGNSCLPCFVLCVFVLLVALYLRQEA